jgi:HemK-related putative methylase
MRRIANRILYLRFLILGRHRHRRLALEQVGDLRLVVLPQVFNPALFPSGLFLVEHLEDHARTDGATVLDLGCGSGICGLAAARTARRVVCANINPEAVRCTRVNALLNGVDRRVEAVESDLFSAVPGQRFDLVLFNPPFFRGHAEQPRDAAWCSIDTLERFAAGLGEHLAPGGFALVVFSSTGDLDGLLAAFAGAGLDVELVAERDTINEILVLYRVSHRPEVSGRR